LCGAYSEIAPSSRTKTCALSYNPADLARGLQSGLRSAEEDALPERIDPRGALMARKDDITGEGPVTGNSVSDSNQKTNRRFKRNLHEKRFYIPSQDRHVKLKVSSKTLKTINKKGIQAVLQEARKQGYDV
jgi:large subunit ribosomal protein L28